VIYQRPADGYINATAMCQAASKQWGHYNEARATREFVAELASDPHTDIGAYSIG